MAWAPASARGATRWPEMLSEGQSGTGYPHEIIGLCGQRKPIDESVRLHPGKTRRSRAGAWTGPLGERGSAVPGTVNAGAPLGRDRAEPAQRAAKAPKRRADPEGTRRWSPGSRRATARRCAGISRPAVPYGEPASHPGATRRAARGTPFEPSAEASLAPRWASGEAGSLAGRVLVIPVSGSLVIRQSFLHGKTWPWKASSSPPSSGSNCSLCPPSQRTR